MSNIIFFIILLSTLGGFSYILYKQNLLIKSLPQVQVQDTQSLQVAQQTLTNQLREQHQQVKKRIDEMPEDLIKSLTGNINTHKGKLGELIGYLSLKAEYDRIIPLGNIVDFICIKFPTDTEEGYVDFIDIKTGDSARLNKDQRSLKLLLANKLINFKTVKIDSSEGLPDVSTSTDKQS